MLQNGLQSDKILVRRRACEAALREIVDPEQANDLAFADQAARVEVLGGRDGILATEDYDFTPIPE